jgi:hypothetical protein
VLLALLASGLAAAPVVSAPLRPAALFVLWYGFWDLAASPIDNFPHVCAAVAVALSIVWAARLAEEGR